MIIPTKRVLFIATILFTLASIVMTDNVSGQESGAQAADQLLKSLQGSWQGTCKTWFKPGELADESEVSGKFEFVLNGKFLRHTYQGSMKGNPRKGEETIVFNTVTEQFQVTWMDDFHMSYATLDSIGPATKNGFSVTGKYDVGGGHPQWSWKTVFELKSKDQLVITAYNITPDGQEGKAVEITYARQ